MAVTTNINGTGGTTGSGSSFTGGMNDQEIAQLVQLFNNLAENVDKTLGYIDVMLHEYHNTTSPDVLWNDMNKVKSAREVKFMEHFPKFKSNLRRIGELMSKMPTRNTNSENT